MRYANKIDENVEEYGLPVRALETHSLIYIKNSPEHFYNRAGRNYDLREKSGAPYKNERIKIAEYGSTGGATNIFADLQARIVRI